MGDHCAACDEKLNAGPQKQYPEFTLAAQQAAMKRIEGMRKQTYDPALRDKTPPAEWIAIAYHGLVVDANLDDVVLDEATLAKMQESMFEVLYKPAARRRPRPTAATWAAVQRPEGPGPRPHRR